MNKKLLLLTITLAAIGISTMLFKATDIFEAAQNNNVAAIQKYIDADGEINIENGDGETLLHWAAFSDSTNVAELLIKHKATIDAPNKDGNTPLHIAASSNAQKVAQLLVDNNADTAIKNSNNQTPADIAASPEIATIITKAELTLEEITLE